MPTFRGYYRRRSPSASCFDLSFVLVLTSRIIPYSQRLYDPSRWATLIQAFRLAIYHLSTLPTEPLLHLAMYAGLASLKLPACYGHATRNVDCPTCNAELGQLAREVPFSHHVNSTIVCRLTGRIMDEDNMPMAFDNGQVYSKEVRPASPLSSTLCSSRVGE